MSLALVSPDGAPIAASLMPVRRSGSFCRSHETRSHTPGQGPHEVNRGHTLQRTP